MDNDSFQRLMHGNDIQGGVKGPELVQPVIDSELMTIARIEGLLNALDSVNTRLRVLNFLEDRVRSTGNQDG